VAEIDQYNETIDSSEVNNRIDELEEGQGYEVVRLRNGDVLANYDDEDDARQYIQDEDYDPERVIVRERELDSDDADELFNLRKLRDAVGVSSGWTLYNESYFDQDWVRDQARSDLGSRYVDFDSWPLSLIDWDDAAASQRDSLYEYSYEFDGVTFYGDE
jgi:hypothetical protein